MDSMSITFSEIENEYRIAQLAYAKEVALERGGVQESVASRFFKSRKWFNATRWFSTLMRRKFANVLHKRDWAGTTLQYRMFRVSQEFLEANEAYRLHRQYRGRNESVKKALIDELVDLANTAMIAADYFRERA